MREETDLAIASSTSAYGEDLLFKRFDLALKMLGHSFLPDRPINSWQPASKVEAIGIASH